MSMTEAVREMTFEEEYEILQAEKNELFSKENDNEEPPFANCVVRRALRCIRKLKEEREQYREHREIFENQFSNDVLKLLSDKEEFAKWLERGRWLAKKCDELGREVEEYRAIGTVSEFRELKEKVNDVCKWEDESRHVVCGHGQVEYRYKVRDWSFCPYCGKKAMVNDWSEGKE